MKVEKVESFEIKERKRTLGNKTGYWDVIQPDKTGKGFWKRSEYNFPANNAELKEKALQEAINYAKKATPYE